MAIYSLNVKTGNIAKAVKNNSARSAYNYICREGKFIADATDVEKKISGNMPSWAKGDPSKYWQAADDYERANGRLYKSIRIALPVELDDPALREKLCYEFTERLTVFEDIVKRKDRRKANAPEPEKELQRLPYTFSIHTNDPNNPHCHLIISERINDGIDRDPQKWFSRAAAKPRANAEKKPLESGGARKTEALKSRDWLEKTRELWAETANMHLILNGFPNSMIDHRTLKEQGIDREPIDKSHKIHRLDKKIESLEAELIEMEARKILLQLNSGDAENPGILIDKDKSLKREEKKEMVTKENVAYYYQILVEKLPGYDPEKEMDFNRWMLKTYSYKWAMCPEPMKDRVIEAMNAALDAMGEDEKREKIARLMKKKEEKDQEDQEIFQRKQQEDLERQREILRLHQELEKQKELHQQRLQEMQKELEELQELDEPEFEIEEEEIEPEPEPEEAKPGVELVLAMLNEQLISGEISGTSYEKRKVLLLGEADLQEIEAEPEPELDWSPAR